MGRVPEPLTSGPLCQDCRGTGANIAATKKLTDKLAYVRCWTCVGSGLDPAEIFRWGPHPPLKGN